MSLQRVFVAPLAKDGGAGQWVAHTFVFTKRGLYLKVLLTT